MAHRRSIERKNGLLQRDGRETPVNFSSQLVGGPASGLGLRKSGTAPSPAILIADATTSLW